MKNLKNSYVIFNDEITELLLSHIRKNIYENYPYTSLSNSELLSKVNIEIVRENFEYIESVPFKVEIPYKWDESYIVYFGEFTLGEVSMLEMKLFDSNKNKEYLELKKKQSIKFQ